MINPLAVAVSAGMAYAGYARGRHIARTCPSCKLVLPTLGWSLLGPVGPGYLVGRLTEQERGSRGNLKGLGQGDKPIATCRNGRTRLVKRGGSYCVTELITSGERPLSCFGTPSLALRAFRQECAP